MLDKPTPADQNKIDQEQREIDIMRMSAFSGPIPAPEQFKMYEETLPGAADRILKMAEREQEQRFTHQNRESKRKDRLSILAFIIIYTALIGGIFLVYTGKPLTGFGTLFSGLAALVMSYYGTHKKEKSSNQENSPDVK